MTSPQSLIQTLPVRNGGRKQVIVHVWGPPEGTKFILQSRSKSKAQILHHYLTSSKRTSPVQRPPTRHQRGTGTQGTSHFISRCQCHAREERGVFSTYPGQGAVPPSLAVVWAHSTSLVCLAWWYSLLLHVLTGAKGLEGGVTEQRPNSIARHHLSVPGPFSPKPLVTQLPWTT